MTPDHRLWEKLPPEVKATLPPPPVRKRRRNEESEIQRALIRWWRDNCQHFGVPEILLLSIPNGSNGDARRGSILKAEGLRRGAPDLALMVPSETRFEAVARDGVKIAVGMKCDAALFLELKTPTGRLSPEQEVFHEHLRARGYRVEIIRSLREGIDCITSYLNPK